MQFSKPLVRKRGLGSFPEPNQGTTPSPEIKTSFIKEVGSYCQYCQVTGHHTRECPLPSRPFPTLPKNYSSMHQNNHFLLSKVKGMVKAKFIGKITKEAKKKLQATLGSQNPCHTCARPKARLGSKNSKMILICVGEL